MDVNVSKTWLCLFSESRLLESVFFIFLMMRFLDLHSEYYKSYVEFPDASIDVLDIEFECD